jgi:hypothetical protein
MGRQIAFHALPDDLGDFLEFAGRHEPVVVALMDSDRPEVEALASPDAETRVMTLWNQELVPSLRRKLVTRAAGGDYYRIPYSLPVLELSPSKPANWNGQTALLRGRLYGFSFHDNPSAYTMWYDALARWIRSHFARSPLTQLPGYLGPAALDWFQRGGILLPSSAPPMTPEWEGFVEAQRSVRRRGRRPGRSRAG